MAILSPPTDLFTATAATTTLEKVLWPGTLTVTGSLPIAGGVSTLTVTGSVVGAVLKPLGGWGSVFLDFAGVGAADLSPSFEIGQVLKDGTLTRPLAQVSLKSITTSGTVTANTNPFTGAAVAATTYRLFDLTTLTTEGNLAQILIDLNGTENEKPTRLVVDVSQTLYLYVIVTSLGTMTKLLCVYTAQN